MSVRAANGCEKEEVLVLSDYEQISLSTCAGSSIAIGAPYAGTGPNGESALPRKIICTYWETENEIAAADRNLPVIEVSPSSFPSLLYLTLDG